MKHTDSELPYENEEERRALEEVMRELDSSLDSEAEELLEEGAQLLDDDLAAATARQWQVVLEGPGGTRESSPPAEVGRQRLFRLVAAGLILAVATFAWSSLNSGEDQSAPGPAEEQPIMLGGEQHTVQHTPAGGGWGTFSWDLSPPPGGWFELTVTDPSTGDELIHEHTYEHKTYESTDAERDAWPNVVQFSVQPTSGMLQVGEPAHGRFDLSKD